MSIIVVGRLITVLYVCLLVAVSSLLHCGIACCSTGVSCNVTERERVGTVVLRHYFPVVVMDCYFVMHIYTISA